MGLQRIFPAVVFSVAIGMLSASDAAEQTPLKPSVQRRVATVLLARRIRAYAAMAQANSDCLVQAERLSRLDAQQALRINLEELGISPKVLANPLVQAVHPQLQQLLQEDCSLDPTQEDKALKLIKNEL